MDALSGNALLNSALLRGRSLDAAAAREKEKAAPSGKTLFGKLLRKRVREGEAADEFAALPEGISRDEAVSILLDDLHSTGAALLARPFSDEIKHYKKSAKALMKFVLRHAYDVEDQTPPGRKSGKYSQIVVLDQKLERMAAEIVGGQLTQLKLLAKVEEINGLLVDLLQ